MNRSIRSHFLRALGALLGAWVAVTPVGATAQVLDLSFSFEQVTNSTNFRYSFELELVDPSFAGKTFNQIYIGDYRVVNGGAELPLEQLSLIAPPTLPSLVGGHLGTNEPPLWVDTQGKETHLGWRLSFGNTLSHGWVPEKAGDLLRWTMDASNPVEAIYFSSTFGTSVVNHAEPASYQLANYASPAPEPGTYALMLLGIAAIACVRMRRVRRYDEATASA